MKTLIAVLGCAVLAVLLAVPSASAAVKKGQKEVSFFGAITNTADGGSTTTTLLTVSGGMFIDEHGQVGGSVTDVEVGNAGGVKLFNAFYKYHLHPQDVIVPYVGGQAGLAIEDIGGSTDSGVSFGGMAGIKYFLSENLSVNPEANILFSSIAGTTVRQTTVQVGLSYYF